jgi:hypothetical protein
LKFSLGALGGGILQSHTLHNGGLHFPNADGSGPQANNLAAAIYGVAIPPGFNGFSSSENYYGNAYTSNGPQPSDLLIGTGIAVFHRKLFKNSTDLCRGLRKSQTISVLSS